MKDALMARLTADVAIASQMKPNCVWVYLSELPPNQMVEFGRVLPLHGKEAEWSAALPEAEKARLKISVEKPSPKPDVGGRHSATSSLSSQDWLGQSFLAYRWRIIGAPVITMRYVRTLRHPEVLARPTNRDGVFTFDLARDGRE